MVVWLELVQLLSRLAVMTQEMGVLKADDVLADFLKNTLKLSNQWHKTQKISSAQRILLQCSIFKSHRLCITASLSCLSFRSSSSMLGRHLYIIGSTSFLSFKSASFTLGPYLCITAPLSYLSFRASSCMLGHRLCITASSSYISFRVSSSMLGPHLCTTTCTAATQGIRISLQHFKFMYYLKYPHLDLRTILLSLNSRPNK